MSVHRKDIIELYSIYRKADSRRRRDKKRIIIEKSTIRINKKIMKKKINKIDVTATQFK